MAMYYYASKISAIACGTRCRQTVLQKSRGQRDRDKYVTTDDDNNVGSCVGATAAAMDGHSDFVVVVDGRGARTSAGVGDDSDTGMTVYTTAAESAFSAATPGDGVRHRRRHSEQLDAYDLELGLQKLEVSLREKRTKTFQELFLICLFCLFHFFIRNYESR